MLETLRNFWDTAVDHTIGLPYVFNPVVWFSSAPDKNSVILDLPPYRQVNSYACGFVAGLIVVHYFCPQKSDKAFWNRVGATPDAGTDQRQLLRALRHSRIRVSVREDLGFEDIAAAVDAKCPVIVTVERSEDMDHWVVIGGYGRSPKRVFLLNESWLAPRCQYTWKDFRKVWAPAGTGLICRSKS